MLQLMIIGILSGYLCVNAFTVDFKEGFSPKNATSYANTSFSSDTRTAIQLACAQWGNAGKGTLANLASAIHNNAYYPLQNNANQITKGYRGADKYIMATYRFINGNKIIESDIDINVDQPIGTASTSYDPQNALTHEIGHALGLGETQDTNTEATMYRKAPKGETKKRTIESDDIAGIQEIYK